MNRISRIKNAQDFYDLWYPLLSDRQARSLENIKSACDSMVGMGAQVRMNAASVGKYCKNHYGPPASQTISNMTATDRAGYQVHVYLNYVRLREGEFNRAERKPSWTKKTSKPPRYLELATTITDIDTKTWVMQLIGEHELEKNSCDFLQEQLQRVSKEAGGLDFAGAIAAGTTTESPMSLQALSPNNPALDSPPGLLSSARAINSIPSNSELPYLKLNDRGALVYDDDVSGAVMILSPSQWQAIVGAVEREEP